MLLVRLDYVILVSCPLSHRLPGVINFIIIIIAGNTNSDVEKVSMLQESPTKGSPHLACGGTESLLNFIAANYPIFESNPVRG